jgi:hypothetical protein
VRWGIYLLLTEVPYSENLMATEILGITVAGRAACMVAAENQWHGYFWPTITNSFVRVSEPCSK